MKTPFVDTLRNDVDVYITESKNNWKDRNIRNLCSPFRLWTLIWNIFYALIQALIIRAFKPPPPSTSGPLKQPRGRIAVIGAGITGVSSAAHAIAHGFEVVIFEAAGQEKLGGIWANVNKTSGLQLNSLLYRFHPSVMWTRGFPYRDEILGEVHRIWKEYHLDTRTRFKTKVKTVRRATPPKGGWVEDPNRTRWIINDKLDELFDAVIVTIGTCGDPNWVRLPGMPEDVGLSPAEKRKLLSKKNKKAKRRGSPKGEVSSPTWERKREDEDWDSTDADTDGSFRKTILHSSDLDNPSFSLEEGQKVVIIGSGASGVEAVETVLQKVQDMKDGSKVGISMIARDDKWIIPRNIVIDTLISGQPFGRQMPLSFLWERFLRVWQYHGIEELIPQNRGIYEGTPIVNDEFLSHVRTGRCTYVRGQPIRLTSKGVVVTSRKSQGDSSCETGVGPVREVPQGEEKLYEADVIVFATGYKKPTLDFLPQDLFPSDYQRPDLYLQNFSTEDWSILLTNSAYMNAIGTVGHFHIGIYTRILLTLLMDPSARPSPKDMKLWVDALRFIKRGATGGALGFFTYMELTIWLLAFHFLRPDRLKWMFFIMNGWGVYTKN